jgi:2-dehydro-3-deoxyphosphogalactonate aldolase
VKTIYINKLYLLRKKSFVKHVLLVYYCGMNWLTQLPLIAILRGVQASEVVAHAQALIDEGFDVIEVPLNSPDWQASIRALVAHCGDKVLLGGGTVLANDEADAIVCLGGKLVVTPNTNHVLISHAVKQGLYVAAGFATVSEAFVALEAGAQALKLFPAATYGTQHVRAIKAVLPDVPIFAVGGVTPQNLGEYMAAGCIGAGLGSDLYKAGQSAAVTKQKAASYVAAYRRAGA